MVRPPQASNDKTEMMDPKSRDSVKQIQILNARRLWLRWGIIFLSSCCVVLLAASRRSYRASSQDATPPGSTDIPISDVIGLTQELELRAVTGTNYFAGRAAIINSAGQIDGAQGNPYDCIHVDGSSGPCDASTTGQGTGSSPGSGTGTGTGSSPGSGTGTGGNFADGELPQGYLDGQNRIFSLAQAPNPPQSLHVYYNGLRLTSGVDYSVSGAQFVWLRSYAPQSTDSLLTDYRY